MLARRWIGRWYGVAGMLLLLFHSLSLTVFVNSNSNIRSELEFVSQLESYLLRVYNVHANTFEDYTFIVVHSIIYVYSTQRSICTQTIYFLTEYSITHTRARAHTSLLFLSFIKLMQLQDICVIRVRLWVMPYALSILVWTVAENCNWCNHYFVRLVHLLILLISLSLPLSLSFSCVFSLSLLCAVCFTFSLCVFLLICHFLWKPLFAVHTFSTFFLSVDVVCLLEKFVTKLLWLVSWRIFLSFRLNAVHRIQLRKIRQPAKRRKTKWRTNGNTFIENRKGKNHTHTQFFLCKRTAT